MTAVRMFVAMALAMCAALLPNLGQAQPFNFIEITDTSGPFSDFGEPDINNAGAVAFRAVLDNGGEGIFLANGGVITTLADTSGPFSDFSEASINSLGRVAFWARHDDGTEGIYSAFSGLLSPIATASSSGPTFRTFDTVGFGARPSIDDAGQVAFWSVIHDTGGSGIFTGSGGPTHEVVRNGAGYSSFSNPTINQTGDMAFFGLKSPGFSHTILKSVGGAPPFEIADTSGPLSGLGVPVIGAAGSAIFLVSLDAGGNGFYTAGNGPVTLVADGSGPYSSFFGHAINASEDVAFDATLDPEFGTGFDGIFTGPDMVADKVVVEGDTILGKQVIGTLFGQGLNDLGEIAFWFSNPNSLRTLAVATPVPEPGSAWLTLSSLALLARLPRRFR